MEMLTGLVATLFFLVAIFFVTRRIKGAVGKKSEVSSSPPPSPPQLLAYSTLDPKQLKRIEEIPQKVLETLQGSANTTAGKLGEIVKFIQLRSAYDRLIPLGDISDFIGIRFPGSENEGALHFIDVKTGKRAALSPEQRQLKRLVAEHPEVVKFVTVKMEIIADGTE